MKALILCADDFGLTDGISEAILDLAASGRVSAVSCMVEGEAFDKYYEALLPLRDKIDIGLHVTLTDQPTGLHLPLIAPAGSFLPLLNFASKCLFNQGALEEIVLSIDHQLEVFQEKFGFKPDFIDGHQHVQNLPKVRDVICNFVRYLPATDRPYIRITTERPQIIVKRKVAVLKALQLDLFGSALDRLTRAFDLKTNEGFAGAYDFTKRVPYDRLFSSFLIKTRKASIVMCHPGIVDERLIAKDPFTDMREVEYNFFRGDQFIQMSENMNFEIRKFEACVEKPD